MATQALPSPSHSRQRVGQAFEAAPRVTETGLCRWDWAGLGGGVPWTSGEPVQPCSVPVSPRGWGKAHPLTLDSFLLEWAR